MGLQEESASAHMSHKLRIKGADASNNILKADRRNISIEAKWKCLVI
jgi:hypothetical protein